MICSSHLISSRPLDGRKEGDVIVPRLWDRMNARSPSTSQHFGRILHGNGGAHGSPEYTSSRSRSIQATKYICWNQWAALPARLSRVADAIGRTICTESAAADLGIVTSPIYGVRGQINLTGPAGKAARMG